MSRVTRQQKANAVVTRARWQRNRRQISTVGNWRTRTHELRAFGPRWVSLYCRLYERGLGNGPDCDVCGDLMDGGNDHRECWAKRRGRIAGWREALRGEV